MSLYAIIFCRKDDKYKKKVTKGIAIILMQNGNVAKYIKIKVFDICRKCQMCTIYENV